MRTYTLLLIGPVNIYKGAGNIIKRFPFLGVKKTVTCHEHLIYQGRHRRMWVITAEILLPVLGSTGFILDGWRHS